eukprot:jgi/Botrbrau1/6891/Bobra.67_3s0010.1
MLAAADIPVTLDVQELMEAKLKVDSELRDVRQRVAEAEKAKDASRCKVCLENEAEAAMTACGHMLCPTCAANVHGRCPFCRKVSGFTRLYRA